MKIQDVSTMSGTRLFAGVGRRPTDRRTSQNGDLLFLLPALFVFIVFFVYPVLSSFYYSLTDWNGISPAANYVGLDNFIRIFTDRDVSRALIVTITFSLTVTVVQNGLGLLLALALDGPARTSAILRVLFLIPTMISALAVGNIWNYLYDPNFGAINGALSQIGLQRLTQDWLGNPRIALFSVIAAHVWQWVGMSMIIYLAGLQGISSDVQEAATIDGVNAWQRFTNITFPLIAPSFTINVVLAMIGTFKVFDIVFVMTGGGPGGATDTLSTLLYSEAFKSSQFGYGTAIGVLMFIFILALSVIQIRILVGREVGS